MSPTANLRRLCRFVLLPLLAGLWLGTAIGQAQNQLLTSGVAASFSYPRVTSPTLFAGSQGFRIEIPGNASRLEVRLEIPSGTQFSVGLKFGSDFQGTRFDADNGGIGNENPVVVTASSSPALRAGTYYVGILVLTSTGPVSGRITATVTTSGGGGGSSGGNTLLASGVFAPYSFPRVTSPTLFSGDFGFRIVVPQGATRLEVRMEIPSGVQFSIGLKFGSDFPSGRFDADNGAIGNENPVVVTTGSSPPLRAGTYYIGIAILSAPGAVSGRITVTVSSGGAPSIGVPATLDLGAAAVGESRDATLNVRNTGSATLRVTSFSTSRTEFRVLSPSTPFDVAASGQQVVAIRFQPTAAGALTATLSIASNDAARPTTTVTLSGQATAAGPGPAVTVSRNSFAFTSEVGTNPPPQTFTIRNSGGGTLTYELSSTQPWMSVSPTSGSSTGSPNTVSISIDTQGLAAGAHTAQIRIVWNGTPTYASAVRLTLEPASTSRLISMSAAAMVRDAPLAPASIAVAAGDNLAATTESATPPLPATLGGIALTVKDSAGVDRLARLYSVSPTQVKYVVPEESAPGPATLSIAAGDRVVATGQFQVESVAPGLFTANANGRGAAVGAAIRTTADGVESSQPLAGCAEDGTCVALAIDPGAETDQIVLALSGTGIRNAVDGLAATIDGEPAEVAGFSPDTEMPGIDLVRIRLPRNLAGSGDVDVVLTVDDKPANVVGVRIGGTPPFISPRITAVSPDSAATGERIAELRLTGQYLTAPTAVEFTPSDGILVGNLRATRTSIVVEVAIAANAATGPRTLRVVTAAGTSNELDFTIRPAAVPPSGGDILPLRSGLKWSYRVTFPAAVDLPYQPIVEQPSGLLCSNVFCGSRRWEAGQIEFEIAVNESLPATQSFRATIADPGRVFLFARSDPVELRLRTVQDVDNFDVVGTPTGFRLVRPLARLSRPPGGQTQTVTVPAGTFANCVRSTIALTGDGISVRGTYITEVLLAPGVGVVRAEMRDSTGRVLYTQELTRFTP